MHAALNINMDTDTETTALCSSSSRQASPPGTPTPEDFCTSKVHAAKGEGELPRHPSPITPRALLEKLVLVPYVSFIPDARLNGSLSVREPSNRLYSFNFPTEDTYERRIMVDKEEVTLIVYDIWEEGDAGGWLRDHCLQTGDAFLIVFSVTDRRSFSKVPETLLRLRAGRPHHDLPIILVGNKSDLARSREVSLEEGRHLAGTLSCKHIETSAALHHNTRELFEGAVRQIRLRRGRGRRAQPPEPGSLEGPAPPARRESLTKKAKRFLANLVPRNAKFFKQRSRSCHDLSVL
uniref:GTP-binding protein REM 2 n=1 Tax=Jaculus jaculus TaxID=51337 RepID=A0A8C5KBL0_JACJA